MKSVGLDLSLTGTGIAILDGDQKLYSGVIRSKPGGQRPIDELERLIAIVDTIEGVIFHHIPDGKLDLVVIENLAFMAQGNTLTKLSGLNYLVRTMCRQQGWKFALVAPLTLKKFVTGVGKGDKNVMLMEIYKRWGESFTDDNEADAYALARAGQSFTQGAKTNESTRHIIQLISSQL